MLVMPFSGMHLNIAKAVGVSVTGTVVSPTGAALTNAGGWVQIDPIGGGPGAGEPVQSNGTFTVNNIATGQHKVTINYGGPDNYTGPAPITITVSSSNVSMGDVRLTTPSITGVLKAPTGDTVITDANISLRSQDWTVNFWTRTDQTTGAFKFGGLGNGTYIITAEAPAGTAYATSETEVVYSGTAITGLTVRLAAPNLKGKIVNSSGGAITFPDQAWFNVHLQNADFTIQRNANVDRTTNEFAFGTLPTGTYTLQFEANGFSETPPSSITTTVTSGTLKNLGDIRMTLAQMQGTVTGPTGTPIQNANLQVHNQDWSVNAHANTDTNGQYRVGGLPAGTYIVELNAPWGGPSGLVSPAPSEVTLTVGGTVTKNLQFVQATKFLTGKVSYVAGTGASAVATGAVSGARVNIFKEGGFGNSSATTDSAGNYTVALSGGTWNVNVEPDRAPGAPPVDWFYAGPPLRVEFANNATTENKTLDVGVEQATATITGTVTRQDGTPISNAWVDARNDRGAGIGTNVQPNGTFSLRLKGGAYRVGIFGDQSLTFPEQQVSINDGETKNLGIIRASTKDARITGKFVDASGNALAGIRVNAFKFDGPGWSNATSESNGEFTLAVTSGRWGVNMDNGSNSSYVYSGEPVDVDLATNTSTVSYTTNTRLLIALTKADATIAGNVVDASGTVITGFCAWVWAQPNTGETAEGERFFGPRYGGPVNCQTGAFSMKVPSKVASSYIIGIDTPPNTEYSPAGTQTVAVVADTTVTKNLVVKKNDATLTGKLVDQNGQDVTGCTSPRGWFGDVHVFGNGGWKGGPIQSSCTFTFSLLSGEYNYGFWIDDTRFLQQPPKDEKITVVPGANTLNLIVLRADVTVNGTVVDPNGNGTDAFVWAGNIGGEEGQEFDFKEHIFTGTKTAPDGSFSLGLLNGHMWEIGTGLPPGSDFMPSDLVEINLKSGTAPSSLTLQLRQALGKMTGSVKIGATSAQFGYVHCWSEQGGFTGGEVRGGQYEVNYVSGTWHCQADSFNGKTFYQSEETEIVITDQTSLAQDFQLAESIFEVPATVSASFDAGEVRNIELENGVVINIPGSALGDSGDTVTVTAAPNVNVNRSKSDKLFGIGYELTAQTSDGTEITTFNSNVTITFPYTEAQLEALGVTEDTLLPKYYDDTTGTWQLPVGITQDVEANTISIQTNHFTTFGLLSGTGLATGGGADTIVASAKAGGGPHVTVWNNDGELENSFMAYATTFRGGVNAKIGDIDGDGVGEIVTVPDSAAGGQVRAFEQDGTWIGDIWPYGSTFRGTLSIALGDVDGDGSDEVIIAPKSNGGPHVRVYNFTEGEGFGLHSQFNAYNTSLRTGIKVYSSDVTGDGTAEIVTVPMPGAPAHVRVLNETGGLVGQFYAFHTGFRGSANISFGDGDSDGDNDLVLAPYMLGGPQVRVVDGGGGLIGQAFAWNSNYRFGVDAAVGDPDNDGEVEIVAGIRTGGGPQVRVLTLQSEPVGQVENQFFAYAEGFRGGMTTMVADIDGSGGAEIITVPLAGGGPHVRTFDAADTSTLDVNSELNFMSHASAFRGGVNLDLGN